MPVFLRRNEFAYASSDKLVYIRQFSDRGAEMTLSAVLQGHEAEVTQVRVIKTHLRMHAPDEAFLLVTF